MALADVMRVLCCFCTLPPGQVQATTGATLRCLPHAGDAVYDKLDPHGVGAAGEGRCIATGRRTHRRALFAKAY